MSGPRTHLPMMYEASGGARAVKGDHWETVTSLTLPAGNFVLMGKALIHNQRDARVHVLFSLVTGTGHDLETTGVSVPRAPATGLAAYSTVPFLCACTLAEAGHVDVRVIEADAPDAEEGVWLAHAQLMAIEVQDRTPAGAAA